MRLSKHLRSTGEKREFIFCWFAVASKNLKVCQMVGPLVLLFVFLYAFVPVFLYAFVRLSVLLSVFVLDPHYNYVCLLSFCACLSAIRFLAVLSSLSVLVFLSFFLPFLSF